jgi:hypothetical protein
MRKNIDIPEEIVKDLKKMAIDADKDLKNFIQDHLVLLVRGQKKKNKKLPQMSNRSGQVAMGHNSQIHAQHCVYLNHLPEFRKMANTTTILKSISNK